MENFQAPTHKEVQIKKYDEPIPFDDFRKWFSEEIRTLNKQLKRSKETIASSTFDWIDYEGYRVHMLLTVELVNRKHSVVDFVVKIQKSNGIDGYSIAAGEYFELYTKCNPLFFVETNTDNLPF